MPFIPLMTPQVQLLEAHSHPDPDYSWKPWTPIYTNLTIGNGLVVARRAKLDRIVIAQFEFTFGSTSVMGTAPTISTPVTATSEYTNERLWLGGVTFLDTTGANTPSGIVRLKTPDLFEPLALDSSGTYLVDALLSSTIPFTWVTGDMFTFTAVFEAIQDQWQDPGAPPLPKVPGPFDWPLQPPPQRPGW